MGHQLQGQEAPEPAAAKEQLPPFITDCHRNAIAKLANAFAKDRPLAILIGEGKSGAAFVVNKFLGDIKEDIAIAKITEPCSTAIEVMREIVNAVGFDPKDMSLGDLEQVLNMFLVFQKKHNRRTIIFIEETENHGKWVLDRLRRFVEMEKKNAYGLMIILSGRPALNDLLTKAPLNATSINGVKRIILAPFSLAETKEYIRRRVEATGASDIDAVFTFNAVTAIQELGAGIPDEISNLCSKCLELADLEGTAPVTTDLVKRAAKLARLANMVPVTNIEEQVSNAEDQIINAEQQVSNAEEQISNAEDQVINAEEQISNAEDQVINAEEQVSNAEEQVSNAEDQVSNAEDQVSNAEERKVQAQEERSPATGRLIAYIANTFAQEQKLNGGHVLIGRDELCDMRLDNMQVSRHHALVVNSSLGVKLLDLGSLNGTFVNGQPIRRHTLQDKDKITVGDCSIEFVAGAGHRSWYFDTDPTVTIQSDKSGPPANGNGAANESDPFDSAGTMMSPQRMGIHS